MIDEAEALRLINEEGETAGGLLREANPNFSKRFNRACRTMRELLADVRKEFPDAEYYTASGGFHLMLGKPHCDRGITPQRELIAESGVDIDICDGDF